jgi:LytS/YehU family sensor histidine kinase
MRHGDGLKVSIQIDSEQKYILPLGLQILVENCIKHNIISDKMTLDVAITEEASYIIVRNNLQRKKVISGDTAPLGLENLKKRYTYITDRPVEIIEDDEFFTVKIPIIESSNE